jgi:hypothetical protein
LQSAARAISLSGPPVIGLGKLLLALMLVAVCSIAQAQEANSGDLIGYPVSGTVLNNLTHEPLARVLVQLSGNLATLTDNEGHFEFASVPPGFTGIQLRRPGFHQNAGGRMHPIQVGSGMASLNYYLTPEAVISGQITLASGDSAEGFHLTLYRKRIINGRGEWKTAGVATTTSDGNFRFADLTAGNYTLSTSPSMDRDYAVDSNRSVIYGYPGVCYPGVLDFSQASTLSLAAGQHGQADFVLTRQPFYPVTATVSNVDLGASVGVQVYDRSGHSLNLPARYDPRLQTVTTNLPIGSYKFVAHSFGLAQASGEAAFNVTGAGASGIRISVLPLHAIRVNIHRDFAAASQASGSVTAPQNSRSLRVELIPADVGDGGDDSAGSGDSVQPDGATDALLLENVQPGSYWVQTTAFDGYVSSISSGGTDLAREPLVVGPGGTTGTIEVTIRNDSATLSGTLAGSSSGSQDGDQSAFIYVLPLFSSTSLAPTAVTASNGQFSFAQLPPGPYKLLAFSSQRELEYRNPEAMQSVATLGKTVTLEPGATASVTLDGISSNP